MCESIDCRPARQCQSYGAGDELGLFTAFFEIAEANPINKTRTIHNYSTSKVSKRMTRRLRCNISF